MRTSTSALNFRKKRGIKLEDFAEGVKAGIYGNLLVFLLVPITSLIFQGLITDFSNARWHTKVVVQPSCPCIRKL